MKLRVFFPKFAIWSPLTIRHNRIVTGNTWTWFCQPVIILFGTDKSFVDNIPIPLIIYIIWGPRFPYKKNVKFCHLFFSTKLLVGFFRYEYSTNIHISIPLIILILCFQCAFFIFPLSQILPEVTSSSSLIFSWQYLETTIVPLMRMYFLKCF